MKYIVGYFILTLIVPAIMLVSIWGLNYLIPNRYLKWYTDKKDDLFDLIAALFGLIMGYYCLLAVGYSYITNGPVMVTAVELGEAEPEIILLLLVFILLFNHSIMQIRIISNRRKNR